MTLPVYNMPKEANISPDQSAVPTVLASGVSPDSMPWSTADNIVRDTTIFSAVDHGILSATPQEYTLNCN